MATTNGRVIKEAISLPADVRISLVEKLLTSLNLPVDEEIDRVIQCPEAWSPMSKNTRRCFVNRFPFGVIYQIKSGFARIIAVANLRRRPDYWLDRE